MGSGIETGRAWVLYFTLDDFFFLHKSNAYENIGPTLSKDPKCMNNHEFEQKLRNSFLEWRNTLDDVNTLYEENSVPQKDRMFKNGWGCINDRDIENLIAYVPKTVNELKQIPGIGPIKITKYGNYLIEIIEACFADK